MTILSVFENVTAVIGLTVPTAVFSGTDRELIELKTLANKIARRIALSHEWELLQTQATITGDGSDTSWPLESDYERMLVDTQLWSSALRTPLTPILSRDRWLGTEVQSSDFIINAWIKYGGEIHIKPALANAVTTKYFYQSNSIVAPSSGSNKTAFTLDTDTFRLSEDLLVLGMIHQWRSDKALAYAENMMDYERLLAKLILADKGSGILRIGRPRVPDGITQAYPAVLG